jgi:hypothetical protein
MHGKKGNGAIISILTYNYPISGESIFYPYHFSIVSLFGHAWFPDLGPVQWTPAKK